jgi:hypothetical protein
MSKLMNDVEESATHAVEFSGDVLNEFVNTVLGAVGGVFDGANVLTGATADIFDKVVHDVVGVRTTQLFKGVGDISHQISEKLGDIVAEVPLVGGPVAYVVRRAGDGAYHVIVAVGSFAESVTRRTGQVARKTADLVVFTLTAAKDQLLDIGKSVTDAVSILTRKVRTRTSAAVAKKRGGRRTRQRRLQSGGAVRLPSEYFGVDSGKYTAVAGRQPFDTAYGLSNPTSFGQTIAQEGFRGPNLAPGGTYGTNAATSLQTGGGGGTRRQQRRTTKSRQLKRKQTRRNNSRYGGGDDLREKVTAAKDAISQEAKIRGAEGVAKMASVGIQSGQKIFSFADNARITSQSYLSVEAIERMQNLLGRHGTDTNLNYAIIVMMAIVGSVALNYAVKPFQHRRTQAINAQMVRLNDRYRYYQYGMFHNLLKLFMLPYTIDFNHLVAAASPEVPKSKISQAKGFLGDKASEAWAWGREGPGALVSGIGEALPTITAPAFVANFGEARIENAKKSIKDFVVEKSNFFYKHPKHGGVPDDEKGLCKALLTTLDKPTHVYSHRPEYPTDASKMLDWLRYLVIYQDPLNLAIQTVAASSTAEEGLQEIRKTKKRVQLNEEEIQKSSDQILDALKFLVLNVKYEMIEEERLDLYIAKTVEKLNTLHKTVASEHIKVRTLDGKIEVLSDKIEAQKEVSPPVAVEAGTSSAGTEETPEAAAPTAETETLNEQLELELEDLQRQKTVAGAFIATYATTELALTNKLETCSTMFCKGVLALREDAINVYEWKDDNKRKQALQSFFVNEWYNHPTELQAIYSQYPKASHRDSGKTEDFRKLVTTVANNSSDKSWQLVKAGKKAIAQIEKTVKGIFSKKKAQDQDQDQDPVQDQEEDT